MQYSLWQVKNKRIESHLINVEGWDAALQEATWAMKDNSASQLEEVWITPHKRDQDVLAVVDREGVRVH